MQAFVGEDKHKGFPKPFRVEDEGGKWPFTHTTPCDAYKDKTGVIFEVPIGPQGQVWGKFGKSPGNYRVKYTPVEVLRGC